MGQEVSMDTERMDSWETVMRVVYPVKDAEQTLLCMRLTGLARMWRKPLWIRVSTCVVWNSAP